MYENPNEHPGASLGFWFFIAGAIALIWGALMCLDVGNDSPASVQSQLNDLNIDSTSRVRLMFALSAGQHLIAGIAALAVAFALFNRLPWAKAGGIITTLGYSAWMTLSVFTWYSTNEPYPGRGFDTFIALIAIVAALLTARAVFALPKEMESAAPAPPQAVERTRFFSDVVCDNPACGKALEERWRFCPYCSSGSAMPKRLVPHLLRTAPCGHKAPADARACPVCGDFIQADSPSAISSAAL